MTRQWPQRFAGLATLPVQDVKAAIDELERAVTVLGLKGAELDTIVNGENWDEPKFLPLFKAAEAMGAVLFFHPQPQHNFMMERTTRYGLFNSLGVIVEDAIVVAMLIFGGVLDACPDLKVCIAHGGGPACYAMGRLDRGWQGRRPTRAAAPAQPPSTYQRRLYYDTVVGSEEALRFLLDQVGADRVVLGSDWPFVPWHPSPVAWVQGLDVADARTRRTRSSGETWRRCSASREQPPRGGDPSSCLRRAALLDRCAETAYRARLDPEDHDLADLDGRRRGHGSAGEARWATRLPWSAPRPMTKTSSSPGCRSVSTRVGPDRPMCTFVAGTTRTIEPSVRRTHPFGSSMVATVAMRCRRRASDILADPGSFP